MSRSTQNGKKGIIDCDVHVYLKSREELNKYLPDPWKERYKPLARAYASIQGQRQDAKPPNGGKPGTDPDFMRVQHIDHYGINYAILMPRAMLNCLPDPDMANAVASAYNDWLADTWLGKYNHDGVFKGSIYVNTQDPPAAAKEIERWAGHPHFVQVMTDSGAIMPYGQRFYYPIYEACSKYGFPFAIHPGTDGMGINQPPTPGYPTRYIEFHTGLSLAMQAHLISYLTEGVFVKYPNLKVVLTEGGVAWLPSLLWRLDAEYKGLRYEVPWLTKPPSHYIRDHVRIASQPLERPEKDEYLLKTFEAMDAEHILMFSSDYPHWDFDSPTRAFPRLPETMHHRIFYENARELYKLDIE
jgi:predicted TIM-barrel fold metal-dependent hydrolase